MKPAFRIEVESQYGEEEYESTVASICSNSVTLPDVLEDVKKVLQAIGFTIDGDLCIYKGEEK